MRLDGLQHDHIHPVLYYILHDTCDGPMKLSRYPYNDHLIYPDQYLLHSSIQPNHCTNQRKQRLHPIQPRPLAQQPQHLFILSTPLRHLLLTHNHPLLPLRQRGIIPRRTRLQSTVHPMHYHPVKQAHPQRHHASQKIPTRLLPRTVAKTPSEISVCRGYRTSQKWENPSTPVIVEIEPLVGEVADGSAGGGMDVAGGRGRFADWEDEDWDCEEGEGEDCS